MTEARKFRPAPVGELALEWLEQTERMVEILPEPNPAEVAREAAEAKVAKIADEQRRRILHAVEKLGIPLRHAQRLMFGQLEDSDALSAMAEWRGLNQRGAVLVLAGQPGCGKTLAAAKAVLDGPPLDHMGRAWPDKWHPRFVDVGDLHELSLYDRTGAYDELFRCSVLVIDDVGTEFDDKAGAMRVVLGRILNKRYSGGGWTIVTTHLDVKTFGKRYGERIMNRLHDDGCGFRHVTGQFRKRTT